MDITDPLHSSIWEWLNSIPTALSIYRDQKPKVLLCGLGGGTIVKQLRLLGYEFEVVELDKRLIEIDKKYFFLDGNVKITIDDARHFINVTDEKYDIIIFDTFLSESAPEQLLSKEALTLVKSKLKKGGMLLTNFYGFTSGDLGYAARSVIKRYMAAGFKVYPLATEEFMRRFLLHVRLATCYSEYYKTCYEDHTYPIGCAICPASSATD